MILRIDRLSGAQMRLMYEFGLRLREAILIKPVPADQGGLLLIEEGTKGGRTRIVRIRT